MGKGTRTAQKRSLVHRYKNAATIIGSLVVLGSFITKEVVQEHLRSTIDSLHSAEQTFQVRSDNIFQQQQLTTLSESMESVRLDQQAAPKRIEVLRHTLQDAIEHDTEIIDTALQRAKQSNKDVRDFITQIPDVKPLEEDVEFSDQQLDKLLQENNSLKGRNVNNYLDDDDFVGPAPDERALVDQLIHLRFEITEARDRTLRVATNSSGLRDKALIVSKRYREEIENKYKRYALAIYVLFGFGWVFGLGGRLLGFDAVTAEE